MLTASLMAAHALTQDMSGWSDKTVCRLLLSKPDKLAYLEEVSSRGLNCASNVTKSLLQHPNYKHFYADFSTTPRLTETDPEVIRQFKENAKISDGLLIFTLKKDSFQNSYDKETMVNNEKKRRESQRSELRFTIDKPQERVVTMSFRFRTEENVETTDRILIAQIKTLTNKKMRHLSHPNVAIYASDGGYVSCVEWHQNFGSKDLKYHIRKINLEKGHIADGRWHDVKMEYTPTLNKKTGLCRVSVDGIIQLDMSTIRNLPFGLRTDKYHMNIGPYRDKSVETTIFMYDDWQVITTPLEVVK